MSEYNSGNKGKYSSPSYPGFPFLCCQSPAVNHGLKVLGGKFQNETIHTFKTAHHFDKWNKIWHCPPSSCLHGNHPLSSVSRLHMFPVHQSLVAASLAPRPQCGRACVHGTLICLNGPKAQGQWCWLDTTKRSYEMLPFHEKYVCIGEKVTQYASCSVLSILSGTTGGLGTYALWMGGGGGAWATLHKWKRFPKSQLPKIASAYIWWNPLWALLKAHTQAEGQVGDRYVRKKVHLQNQSRPTFLNEIMFVKADVHEW